MKSYRECVAEYTATKKNIAELDKRSEELTAALREAFGKPVPPSQRTIAVNEEVRERRDRLNEIAELKNIQEILLKIWKENARCAIFAENVGAIAELIGKFAGKPFGEKTAAKFKAEFKAMTGYNIYLSNGEYRQEICLMPEGYFFRTDDLCITVNGDLFDGNKLVAHAVEDFKLNFCADYVENPVNRAREIVDRFAELKAAYAQFEIQCKAFNELLPSSINNVYAGNFKGYLS